MDNVTEFPKKAKLPRASVYLEMNDSGLVMIKFNGHVIDLSHITLVWQTYITNEIQKSMTQNPPSEGQPEPSS